MSESSRVSAPEPVTNVGLRDWFADHLGIGDERKGDIYEDISKSTSLGDVSYWLQLLFAAGIATLGLALNSPAVIIGGMLISPLMGPILAAGLALASGDIILGIRSLLNLTLSCLLAIAFAVFLVSLLPFKEMTNEIAARTQPTTLDLAVALFSGAIGSIAICKEVKGVVTSIPGVAIAVALMPPLCVVGYGIGISFSLGASQGMQVARGGGLLFLTNLVAITFTAMVVFLTLHIDSLPVKERILSWRMEDKESNLIRNILNRIKFSGNIRKMGSLPGRVMIIGVALMIILVPLSQSLSQLQAEITEQRNVNRIRLTVTELWRDFFERLPSGETRSYLDQVSITEQVGRLVLGLTVITTAPYTTRERNECTRLIAERLKRAPETISLQIIEIPTTEQLALRAREERVEPPPTISQLQSTFLTGVDSSLGGLVLPPPAQLISYSITTSKIDPLQFQLSYLSDRDIDPDGLALIEDSIKTRLGFPDTRLRFERVPETIGTLPYTRSQNLFSPEAMSLLDSAGLALFRFPNLNIDIGLGEDKNEQAETGEARKKFFIDHFKSKWQVDESRIRIEKMEGADKAATVRLRLAQT